MGKAKRKYDKTYLAYLKKLRKGIKGKDFHIIGEYAGVSYITVRNTLLGIYKNDKVLESTVRFHKEQEEYEKRLTQSMIDTILERRL